jgi:hypothetical protein
MIYTGKKASKAGDSLGAKSYDIVQDWFISFYKSLHSRVLCKVTGKRADIGVENAVRKAWIASASQSIADVEDNTVVGKIEILWATSEQDGKSYRTSKRPYVGVTEMVKKPNTFSMRRNRVGDVVAGYQFVHQCFCGCVGSVLDGGVVVRALSVLALWPAIE